MIKRTILETCRVRTLVLQRNKDKTSNKNLSETIAGVTLMAGLTLGVLMTDLYRLTIISWRPALYFSLAIGVFLTLVTRNTDFVKEAFTNSNILYNVSYYAVAVGTTISYVFFAINHYFAFPETAYQSFQIKGKTSMSGDKGNWNKRTPLIIFDYYGQEKELVFAYSQTSQVAAAHRVGIAIKKGRLGFDVIQSRELLN